MTPRPDSFPRHYARTRRFSLGEPRAFQIFTPTEGHATIRVLFLRSRGGSDPVNCLWLLEADPTGATAPTESLIVDPLALGDGEGDLPPEELARRERMRETSSGITAFSTDTTGTTAVFCLGGLLCVTDVARGATAVHSHLGGGIIDPRIDPTGRQVAFVREGALHRITLNTPSPAAECIASEPSGNEHIMWGSADFIAGEEFNRYRGFWWSPDGTDLLVQRTDESPVATWWISDPAHPERPPVEHRYPAAGTANASVSLHLISADDRSKPFRTVAINGDDFPYFLEPSWNEHALLIPVLDRSQGVYVVHRVDVATGTASRVVDIRDDRWVEHVSGFPVALEDGTVLTALDVNIGPELPPGGPTADEVGSWLDPDGTRTVVAHRQSGTSRTALGPANLQVKHAVFADDHHVVVAANASRPIEGLMGSDTASTSLVALPVNAGSPRILVGGDVEPGVHDGVVTWPAGSEHPTMVVRHGSLDRERADISLHHGGVAIATITNLAEVALVSPAPTIKRVGARGIPTAVLMPTGFDPLEKYPVLLDPYGGPHAPRVLRSRNAFATSQWFADQGFIVVVADNRGVPGPGPWYEKSVHLDLAGLAVEDQADALMAITADVPQADLSRVAIRGWSFGGFLAAACVLRRPDVFHAAIVGAPVTEWALYDTAYTERYLGTPQQHPEAYARSSVVADAHLLQHPMMIVHGLADDNVVVANSLRLSSALLAAGKAHEVLPLSGVTHMTPQEEVAENLLLLQLDFLRRALSR
jgi:dipeptidyl-peptidase 4